jgi:flavorubredoxin
MKPVKIAENIYSVGVKDFNLRDFHGYSTPQGSSYNAYLIIDEKTVLIDTVKNSFKNKLIENISSIIDPKKIDYVISNHTEMDHSGSLSYVMHVIGGDKPVFCSKMGEKNLKKHFGSNFNFSVVKTGDTLNIGKKNLSFMDTKMIHWPDSMFTYLQEDKILFSSDAFGQHYSGSENFDDELNLQTIMPHAKKYFANILMHLSDKILKLLESVKESGIEISMICPDHGIVWRSDPLKIISAYESWTKAESTPKAVIAYDTMWKSTEKMAEAIADGIASVNNVDVKLMCIRNNHRSNIITEMLDTKAIVIGSPTMNNMLYPTVADMLTYIKGLRPKNKIGAAFGSYGWSGEAVKLINKELETAKIDLIDEGLRIQYVPRQDEVQKCYEYGEKIGRLIIKS